MTRATRSRIPRIAALARPLPVLTLLALLGAATPAAAQRADFLFGQPHATIALSTGWAMPGEGSDLFDFTRDNLTVSRGDFASPFLMAEVGIRTLDRFDVTLGLEFAGSSVPSEDENYVWDNEAESPVVQTTKFNTRRVMGGLKAYLLPRGREISQYAWIPARWSPYIGGGVGVTWYEFLQEGDFVDYETLAIFEDRFQTEGRGFTTHLMGGADVTLSPHFLLRVEYRHIWGSAGVDQSVFEGFNDIDVSGSRVTVGVAFRT